MGIYRGCGLYTIVTIALDNEQEVIGFEDVPEMYLGASMEISCYSWNKPAQHTCPAGVFQYLTW